MGAAVDRLDGGGMTEDHTPDTTAEFDDVESENLPDSAAMPDQDDTDAVGNDTDPVGDDTDPVGDDPSEIRPPLPPRMEEPSMTDPIDPPSAATAPPPIRRLRRLVRGKPVGPLEAKLGGVSAGIGRYLSIEPIYLRAAFAVALLFNGVGALLYLAAWLLMPNDDDRRPQPIVPTDSVLRLIAGGAVLVGGVAVITDPFSINVGDLFVPLVLIAAGVWFLDRRPDINPPTQPAPPMGQPASTWNPTSGVSPSTVSGSTALLDPPAPTAHWATPLAAEPEARVPVATIALAGTAALFGLALLLDSFDAIDPDPVVYAAIPCLGFGLGLVASALIRGARSGLLVLLSLFSLLPLALTAASGPALFGGVGEALTIVVGELDGDYRWGIGEHVVDLLKRRTCTSTSPSDPSGSSSRPMSTSKSTPPSRAVVRRRSATRSTAPTSGSSVGMQPTVASSTAPTCSALTSTCSSVRSW